MARVAFSEENKNSNEIDWTKLKLKLVKDEQVRVACVEEPYMEYVHQLRAPKIQNGVPVMKTVERRDGTSFEDYDMDFIARPICLGDEGTLADKGSDPANCPICEMASQTDMATPPQRRFAMNVLQYNTKPGSFALTTPYSVSVVVWAFTDKVFGKLADFQTEWGPLTEHDLLLGPCTNPMYQQFDIAIAKTAEWLSDEDRKRQSLLAFKENQVKDLVPFCGRKQERRWMEDDLTTVRNRWKLAKGGQVAAADHSASQASLTEGFTDLLESVGTKEHAEAQPEWSKADTTESVEAVAEPETAAVSSGTKKTSFDELLKDLDG